MTTRAAYILFTLLLFTPRQAFCFEPSGYLEIHYINVGHALSTLVIGPDGTTVLMDAGKSDTPSTIVTYLQKPGLELLPSDGLDFTIASHLHMDHIRGFKKVFDAGYDVPAPELGEGCRNCYNGSDYTSTYVTEYESAAAGTSGGGPDPVLLDRTIWLGDGAWLKVVAVHGNVVGGTSVTVPNENDRSVGVVIKYEDFDFVWTGDLGGGDETCSGHETSQKDVETSLATAITPGGLAPLLSGQGVDVLHVNHHGSESSTNSTWMNLLQPEVAIISVGDAYGNPESDVVDSVLLASATCVSAPPALVLQTDEGDLDKGASTSGYVVGDIVIMTNGSTFGVGATGRASGADERGNAGLLSPHTFLVDESAPACPMLVALSDSTFDTTEIRKAKHLISIQGTVQILGGGDLLLQAGTHIVIGNGFSVEDGGRFTAEIEPLTDCT